MWMSEAGREMVEGFEGLRLEAYQDVAGIWTIGYGHTGPEVYDGLVWDQVAAGQALTADLQWAEKAVGSLATNPTQNQFDAMVSLCFNIGAENFRRSAVLQLHNQGQFEGAARSFMNWDHAHVGGRMVVVPGLEKRRAAEAACYAKA